MGRIGTLWQGRFWASPVDTASYFFKCQRYIELNPVRAGLVGQASDYGWSSYRSNAWGEASGLLVPHQKYLQLGADPPARQAAYRDFFGGHVDDLELQTIRAAIRGGLPVGSEQFIEDIERLTGRRLRRKRPGRPARGAAEKD
jgi:putative transposase